MIKFYLGCNFSVQTQFKKATSGDERGFSQKISFGPDSIFLILRLCSLSLF